MSTHKIPLIKETRKDIPIMPPDLALLSTLIGSNYLCLELIFMVPRVFEPLKFYCSSNYYCNQGKCWDNVACFCLYPTIQTV